MSSYSWSLLASGWVTEILMIPQMSSLLTCVSKFCSLFWDMDLGTESEAGYFVPELPSNGFPECEIMIVSKIWWRGACLRVPGKSPSHIQLLVGKEVKERTKPTFIGCLLCAIHEASHFYLDHFTEPSQHGAGSIKKPRCGSSIDQCH